MTEFAQAIITSIIFGSLWGLLGTGLGLILGVTGRFNFAFAITLIGPVFLIIALEPHIGLIAAILVGVAFAALFGVALELFLFKPLVDASPSTALLAVFVSSLGVVIMGQAVIQLIWGTNAETLAPGFAVTRIQLARGIGFTTLDAVTVGVCLVVLVALTVFMKYARFGRRIRAVRENPGMSLAIGIHPEAIYVAVFAIGSVLSVIGGILLSMRGVASNDGGIQPTFTALVVLFLAGFYAGPIGFLTAGLFVALIQNVVSIWLSADWQPAVTFGILFIYIALLPYTEGRIPRLRLPARRKVATEGSL